MTAIIDERLYSIPAAFEEITGQRPHPTTCWRWTKRGVNGVKLEATMLGGRMLVTRQACQRFIDALTNAREQQSSFQPTDVRRSNREIKAAEIARNKLRRVVGEST